MKVSHQTLNVLLDCYSYAGQNSDVPLLEYNRDSPQNYTILAPLARGSYGEVFVVQHKKTKKMFALKRLSKEKIKNHPNTALFLAERNCMIESKVSKWLISVYTTFQTSAHLFFLMDFYPGGDLLSLLSKMDVLSDEYIRFYAGELILAVKELHALGFIHRDIKPDNILLTQTGHIRLGDFGSCVKTDNGIVRSNVSVGTPDYISPEVLSSVNLVAEYSYEVDVWSIGVVIYEMVNGQTPFYHTSLVETYKRINAIDYENKVGSSEVREIISAMICRKDKRRTLDEIMGMIFFRGVDFEREMVPPYLPGNDWTINFQDSGFVDDEKESKNFDYGKFIGFTFDENVILIDNEKVEDNVNDKVIDDEKITQSVNLQSVNFKGNTQNLNTENQTPQNLNVQSYKIDEALLTMENNMKLSKIKISKMNIRESMNRLQMYIENISSQHELISYYVDHLSLRNSQLKKENRKQQSKVEVENALYVEELKKELRKRKMETRELEQRIDEEVLSRNNLQDEIKYLKTQLLNLQSRTVDINKEFLCRRIQMMSHGDQKPGKDNFNFKRTSLQIINQTVILDEYEEKLNNVFVDDCNLNEVYFLGEKKRALTIKVVFMVPKDTYSMTSVKSLEDIIEEKKREQAILEGIDKLILHTKGEVLKEAYRRREGTMKRIEELDSEMDLVRSGTLISVDRTSSKFKVQEYKNHKFITKTFSGENICYHCQNLLYGSVDQGSQCMDCNMIVHRHCYILIKESCELHRSMKGGRLIYLLMDTLEEKEKMLKIFNHS